jgi:hypothetical protein
MNHGVEIGATGLVAKLKKDGSGGRQPQMAAGNSTAPSPGPVALTGISKAVAACAEGLVAI